MLDEWVAEFDRGLRSIAGVSRMSRPVPSAPAGAEMTLAERAHAAGLMRVNHVGEICAQALYQAQFFDLLRRTTNMRSVMVLVGEGLLLWQHDGNGGDAVAVAVADRRGDAGNRIIRFACLDRQASLKGLGGGFR